MRFLITPTTERDALLTARTKLERLCHHVSRPAVSVERPVRNSAFEAYHDLQESICRERRKFEMQPEGQVSLLLGVLRRQLGLAQDELCCFFGKIRWLAVHRHQPTHLAAEGRQNALFHALTDPAIIAREWAKRSPGTNQDTYFRYLSLPRLLPEESSTPP
jgi:hypothetical protein